MRKLSHDLQTLQGRLEANMDSRTKGKSVRAFYMALTLFLAVAYFTIRMIFSLIT